MASVFKRSRDKGKKGSSYWINYVDADGKRRRKKAFTDKARSEQLAAKLESDAKAIRDGLVSKSSLRTAENLKLSIAEHVSAYRAFLGRNDQTTDKHINLVIGRIERTIKAAGFQSLVTMDQESVEKAVANLRDEAEQKKKLTGKGRGFGAKTFNHYLSGFESFGKWLYESKRIDVNPFRGFRRMITQVDVRKKRRALTTQELDKLLKAARASGVSIQCYDGETRARIYTVAALTGLRRSEIATLTPESFTGLEAGNQAMLKVEAACSKRRREDNVPVHKTLVSDLNAWLVDAEPGQPLFPKLEKRKTFEMIAKDLKRAGIAYKNKDGDADFHALRHTFISHLLSGGASVTETKELARHSDVQMTMRYTHVEQQKQALALDKLDLVTSQAPQGCQSLTVRGNAENRPKGSNRDLSNKKPTSDSNCQRLAFVGNGADYYFRAEDTGVEPATREGN